MSALVHDGYDGRAAGDHRRLAAMTIASLDEVLAIENQAYEFAWTRGNFLDSLAAGYTAQRLLDERDTLLGYYVAMAGVDEMHLLNITVAPAEQHRGHARFMLDDLIGRCRSMLAQRLWLEVRSDNARAQAIYERFGFCRVGLRKGYYPAPQGRREDAVVMNLTLPGPRDAME